MVAVKEFLQWVVSSAERSDYGPYKNVALRNSNSVAILCASVCFSLALICLYFGAKTYALVNLMASTAYLASVVINANGHICKGRATVHFTSLLYIFFLSDSLGHQSNIHYFYFAATIFPIVAFEYQKRKAIIVTEVCTLLFLVTNFVIGDQYIFPKFLKIELPYLKYAVVALSMFFCYYLLHTLVKQYAHVYEEAEKNKGDLIKSAKMLALGEMSSGLAHEMNNSLGIVMGMVSILKKEIKDNPRLATIERSCQKMAHIVRALRDFSKSSGDEPSKETSLTDIINQANNFTRAKITNKGIELKVAPIPQVTIDCRPFQLTEVLMNILNNSYDAVCDLKEKWINIEFKVDSTNLTIMITDSGNGIPPQILDQIMNPFFTTKGVGKGSGLGLCTSKGIIEAHKGKFFYNQLHLNTQFIIILPIKNNLEIINDEKISLAA